MSTPVLPSLALEVLYSHYEFVRNRINAVTTRTPKDGGANNVVAGILNAQDWPPRGVKLEMFYMLILGRDPVGRQGFSAANPIKFHIIQWTWIIKGSDLQQGVRQAYRGDRFVTMQTMEDELIYGINPNYAERQSWALQNGVFVATSFYPRRFFTWTPVSLHEKFDKDSGIAYGTGQTRLQDIPLSITT